MTSQDTKAFREIYGVLCATFDRVFDEAQSKFYFTALKDCELADVKATALELAQTVKWFPKPAEWRQAIGIRRFNARRERERQLAQRSLTGTVHCEKCRDTGMRPSDANPDRYTHCECRDENPNYQIARARQRIADESEETPQIPNDESKRITDTVRDFKRLSSGE